MRYITSIAIAAVTCGLLGFGLLQPVRAQQTPARPAYIIAEVQPDPTKAADPAGAKRYAEETPKLIARFGGRYLVRSNKILSVEGVAPKGYVVVIVFDSLDKAKAWYYSPEYSALKPIRQNTTKSRIYIVEGDPPS